MPEIEIEEQPTDRLTRMAGHAIKTIEQDPESRDDEKIFILLRSPDGEKSGEYGMEFAGFEDRGELIAYLLTAVEVLGAQSGMKVLFMPEMHAQN